jgi:hypothetical protein
VESITLIAPNIAAALLMLLGGAALVFPKTMAAFVVFSPLPQLVFLKFAQRSVAFFWG